MKKAASQTAPRSPDRAAKPAPTGIPTLGALHPAASRWIAALIRMTAPHPAMTQILDVIERMQDRPFRTNYVLLGEPGTGKEGLARALHHLSSPGTPLVRFDVTGFPEEAALARLCGVGQKPGAAEEADGGALLIEEAAGMGPRVQAALLRLLKSGHNERLDAKPDARSKLGDRRLRVQAIAMSDQDLMGEVRAGRFRHDLYYRLARIVLWLPPLRERPEDIGPAAVWMGNRILSDAGLGLDLMTSDDFARLPPSQKKSAVELRPDAVRELEMHTWPGNLRELEALLERALLLYRAGDALGAEEIRAALAPSGVTPD